MQTEVAGVRVIARKGPGTSGRASGRAGERDRKRRGVKARETGQTSCYILEEHSNYDMKREAHSVNEDPRGNASGTRREGEERDRIYACSGDEDEREKERGKRDGKGARRRAAGRESRGASCSS